MMGVVWREIAPVVVLFLLLFSWVSSDVTEVTPPPDPCASHPYYSRHQCACFTPWHVLCPGVFSASSELAATTGTTSHSTQPIAAHLAVQCHQSDPLPPQVLPLSEVRALVLSDCVFDAASGISQLASSGSGHNLTDLSIYCRPGQNYTLRRSLLQGLPHLRFLHVWCPGLEDIEPDFLSPVRSTLTHLTIRGSNKLSHLDERLFENMNQLILIRIKDNPNLITLPSYLFYGLKQLKSLYLDHNAIQRLHARSFESLVQLTDLSVVGNGLHVLEPFRNESSSSAEPRLVLLGQVELAHALYHQAEVGENSTSDREKRDTDEPSLFQNLQSLTELRLDYNIVPTLQSISNLKKLRLLSLRNCSVRELNRRSLEGLGSLEWMDLSSNFIRELPTGFLQPAAAAMHTLLLTENRASTFTLGNGALSGLAALRELNLSHSGLKDLPFGALSDLKSLRILDLSNNHLNELPRFLFQTSADLEVVDLSNNVLTHLSSDLLENLSQLRTVDVSNNVLSRLPPHLFADTKRLQSLECRGNKLRTLGAHSLAGLGRARHLDLSGNALATIDPETFVNMAAPGVHRTARKASVDLRNFTRSSPPRPMAQVRVVPGVAELRNLSLANNRLVQLSSRLLAPLTALQRLDLSNNALAVLPTLSFLQELRELVVSGNRLRELPAPLFLEGGRLHTFAAANNFLADLPPSLLAGLGETLTWLDVSHNSLAEFHSPLMAGLGSLRTLELAHNRLRSVDFSALTNIREADLAHNMLSFKEAGWVFYRSEPAISSPGPTGRELGAPSSAAAAAAAAAAGHWGRQASFGNCTRLERLLLANNSVSELLLDLRRLPSLRLLDLTHNSLSALEGKDLQFVSPNLTVDVRHNRITQVRLRADELIPASAGVSSHGIHSSGSPNVRLLLDHNPLWCDCRLPNLLRLLFGDAGLRVAGSQWHAAHVEATLLECASPASVKGKRVIEVETWGHYLLPLLGLCHVFH